MREFNQVASKHGIDPNDQEAVDAFFTTTMPTLPREQQQAIFDELFDASTASYHRSLHEHQKSGKLIDVVKRVLGIE